MQNTAQQVSEMYCTLHISQTETREREHFQKLNIIITEVMIPAEVEVAALAAVNRGTRAHVLRSRLCMYADNLEDRSSSQELLHIGK